MSEQSRYRRFRPMGHAEAALAGEAAALAALAEVNALAAEDKIVFAQVLAERNAAREEITRLEERRYRQERPGPFDPCPLCGCCPPHMGEAERVELTRLAGVAEADARWEAKVAKLRARSAEMHNNPSYLHALAIMGADEETR